VVAGDSNAVEQLAHFGVVVDEPQQRLAARTFAADTENVFCGRIQINNEQVFVQQDDAGIQAVENGAGVAMEWAVSRTGVA
jgi:hypothetical protein